MVKLAPPFIRYFVTLKFSLGKCPTVSPVVFMMAVANKSKGLSLSSFIHIVQFFSNYWRPIIMVIMILSHSWWVFVKFHTHSFTKVFWMKLMTFFLWKSFTNIIRKTDSIWTLFTFCNSHSFKLTYKSNKLPFFRINFFFVRIRIKMFFIFSISVGWIRQNEQTKLILLYIFSSPRYPWFYKFYP